MTTLTADEAKKRLDEIVEALATSHDVVEIVGDRHSAVLLTEEDWQAIQETLHLSSIPGMKQSIIEGLQTPVDACVKELDW